MERKVHAFDDVLAGESIVVEWFVRVGAVGLAPVDLYDRLEKELYGALLNLPWWR